MSRWSNSFLMAEQGRGQSRAMAREGNEFNLPLSRGIEWCDLARRYLLY